MTGCVIREVILLLHKGDRAVIVTMIPVRVVKMTINQIIDMVAMIAQLHVRSSVHVHGPAHGRCNGGLAYTNPG